MKKSFICTVSLLLITSSITAGGIAVYDAVNSMQVGMLNQKATAQINQLNTIIGIGNKQLDQLEALYAAMGSQKVNTRTYNQSSNLNFSGSPQNSNPTSTKSSGILNNNLLGDTNIKDLGNMFDVDLEGLTSGLKSGFVSNFLDMDFEQWSKVIAEPKEAIGDMLMDNLSGKILSSMNLPPSAKATIGDYLRNIKDIDMESKAGSIANDIANYYYAHYNQRTEERTQQRASLSAKHTAITNEIEGRVNAGQATLNEQMAGQNQLSATQNEILLNTSIDINEANGALINTENAIRQNAEELNEFEKDKERLRSLLAN